MSEETPAIGTLNENPLHAGLKQWCARPGDQLEVPVDGYVVDIVRDGLLIEIQTGAFYPIRDKLRELAAAHRVRLVCPLAREKWLLKLPEDAEGTPSRRKSPKHCGPMDLFEELVSIPELPAHPNFALQALLTEEEEVRRREPGRARHRHGWVVQERRLVEVLEDHVLGTPQQLAQLLPAELDAEFTTAELAEAAGIRRRLAQKACYCLRRCGGIEQIGHRGRAYLYRRSA